MPAKVIIQDDTLTSAEYVVNSGQDGRALSDVLNGISVLAGVEVPTIDQVYINESNDINWDTVVVNGDEIFISRQSNDSEEEDTPEEGEEEVSEDGQVAVEDQDTKERIITKTVTIPADLTNVANGMTEINRHIECLSNDLSVLEERMEMAVSALSSMQEIITATKEHTETFNAVHSQCVEHVNNANAQHEST